jgi:hypothetical protein
MPYRKIKIGYQQQAQENIFLYENGKIMCGEYQYDGRLKKDFAKAFQRICELAPRSKYKEQIIDVSECKFWSAIDVYDYMVSKWQKSCSIQRVEHFANDTEIRLILNPIHEEFKRAVSAKWKRVFKNSDINDPNTPTKGWHVFKKPPYK